uniref:Nucleotide-diphospho-sugar transferase domain-containing protein n=1 Tax=Ascaris lumbricoides TaxID=6252 RepID=A0A9J2PYZ2_ASCLU
MRGSFLIQLWTNIVAKIFTKCNATRRRIALLFCLVSIALIEEAYIASARNAYRNFYRRKVPAIIYKTRWNEQLLSKGSVAIISVLKDRQNYEEYRLAQESFKCYAIYHKYPWVVVDLSTNETLRRLCPQKDFMFARHCVVAHKMDDISEHWILFIDADMGVINPNHLIEEWIDVDVDLIFYDRIFNFEIMAGSYLVRNSDYGRKFLNYWANYEYRLPSSFHGSDNGAIHVPFQDLFLCLLSLARFERISKFQSNPLLSNVFMELMVPQKVNERRRCEKVWNASKSFDDLFVYEACAREVLGRVNKWPGKARVLKKGTAWSRDTWLTNSMWCEKDFVLHGWQKRLIFSFLGEIFLCVNFRKMDAVIFASWPSPFTSIAFNMSLCGTKDAGLNWSYKDTFIRTESEIEMIIDGIIAETAIYYKSALDRINNFS